MEATVIYRKLRKCIEIRKKYIKLSYQGALDNPRDKENYVLDPPLASKSPDFFHKDPELAPITPNRGKTYSLGSYDLSSCNLPETDDVI